jgi:hypothetical protein
VSIDIGKWRKGDRDTSVRRCGKTFPEHFDSLYYGRHLAQEEVHTIIQAHAEGSSLRGISRLSGRAYGTVVCLILPASHKAQMIHNQKVKQIETPKVIADEMWSFVEKNTKAAREKS